MPFKRFDAETCQGTSRSHDSFLRIVKVGTISFSTGALELMQLTEKNQVAFFQNEESPEDWYVISDKSSSSFKLRWGKTGDKAVVQNAFLAKKILHSSGDCQAHSLRLKLIRSDVKIDNQPAFLLITTVGISQSPSVEMGHNVDDVLNEVSESFRKPFKADRRKHG